MSRERKTATSSLRKAVTLQTLVRGTKPRGRPQVANRLARLENERARLEHEMGMWENCRQMAASKLQKVRNEIESLRPLLNEAPSKRAVYRKGRGRQRVPASLDAPGGSTLIVNRTANRTMQLEY